MKYRRQENGHKSLEGWRANSKFLEEMASNAGKDITITWITQSKETNGTKNKKEN
jgi:hypothetical protein